MCTNNNFIAESSRAAPVLTKKNTKKIIKLLVPAKNHSTNKFLVKNAYTNQIASQFM